MFNDDNAHDTGREAAQQFMTTQPPRIRITAEQQARDMLERLEVEGAQQFTAGDLVEIANAIADASKWREFQRNPSRFGVPIQYE